MLQIIFSSQDSRNAGESGVNNLSMAVSLALNRLAAENISQYKLEQDKYDLLPYSKCLTHFRCFFVVPLRSHSLNWCKDFSNHQTIFKKCKTKKSKAWQVARNSEASKEVHLSRIPKPRNKQWDNWSSLVLVTNDLLKEQQLNFHAASEQK